MTDRIGYLEYLKQKAQDGYEYYKKAFAELEDAYFMIYSDDLLTSLIRRNKSRNYIPKLNAKAKRIYDGLTETYFNNDKFAKLEPYINSSGDVIDKWQEAIDHYAEMLNLYKVFAPIFLKAPFSASCVAKVFWGGEKAEIESINLEDVYFDPEAKNIKELNYIVHRIYLSNADIKKLVKQKIFKAESKELFDDENMPYDKHECFEIYERIGSKWFVSTLFNSTLLRDKVELADGQPFIVGYMLPQVKRIDESNFVCAYGEPALASMLPLQNELNVNRNSINDVVRQQVNPKLILDKSAMISRVDLESIGVPIYTNQPSAVQVLPSGDIGGAMTAINIIENEMSEVSGISPQQNGASTVRKETATMASIMANEGSVRLQGYIRTFNETFFEPIFERLAILVWKYADPIFFAGFSRGEVPSFNININTGIGALNKEVQKQSLMDAGSLIASQFGMCLQLGDTDGANRMKDANERLLLELLPLYGIKNADEFIGKENKLKEKIVPQQPQMPQMPQPQEMAMLQGLPPQQQPQGGEQIPPEMLAQQMQGAI